MGKGEIARYEQFLLFPQCFQKACFPGVSKGVIVWEWVNTCKATKSLTLSQTSIAPFTTVFSTLLENSPSLSSNSKLSSANRVSLEAYEIRHF